MNSRHCQFCGSKNFRADRALAGRLVCQSCGKAIGSFVNSRAGNQFSFKIRKFNKSFYLLLIITILLIIMAS